MTLEEKQRTMRERNKRSVKRGRPTANDVEELDAWRIEIAQAHFFAYCLLKQGLDSETIANEIRRNTNVRCSPEAIEKWIEAGYPLRDPRPYLSRNQRLTT